MSAALARRVAVLERALARHGGCNVITYALGESPAAAIARATAGGMRGGFLVVPEVLSANVWVPLALTQQRELMESLQEH